MNHYEILLIIHPDQSEQVSQMVERYTATITGNGGQVHRYEDWGRRQLAYPIQKLHKAHYVLLNIECNTETLDELENTFKFNDAVLRKLVLNRKNAISTESPIMKHSEDKRDQYKDDSRSGGAPRDEQDGEPDADGAEDSSELEDSPVTES